MLVLARIIATFGLLVVQMVIAQPPSENHLTSTL
jgi:hypothetical protein